MFLIGSCQRVAAGRSRSVNAATQSRSADDDAGSVANRKPARTLSLLRFISRRRLIQAAVVMLCLSGLGWGAWTLIVTPPLFEDNFNRRWIDFKKWDLGIGRPILKAEHGYLRLMNRADGLFQAQRRRERLIADMEYAPTAEWTVAYDKAFDRCRAYRRAWRSIKLRRDYV